MNKRSSRITAVAILALAMLAPPSSAQQKMAPAPQSAPASSQPAVAPQAVSPAPAVQANSPVQAAPAMPSAAAPPAPPATDATAAPADGGNKPPKSTVTALRELSPWSMFLSADILVKAVMIGLAFASLVTWTVGIAKTIELSLAQIAASLGGLPDDTLRAAVAAVQGLQLNALDGDSSRAERARQTLGLQLEVLAAAAGLLSDRLSLKHFSLIDSNLSMVAA